MGTRTIRIPRSKIEAQLSKLPGQSAQVVMCDGKTHAGRVQSAAAEGILLIDANAAWTSQKRHTQALALADISFIILDVNSPW
jgi:hypothetical protein